MKGIKKDSNKPKLGLIFKQFPNAIEQVVRASMFGHEKYKDTDRDYLNMYRLENARERYFDALLRHSTQEGIDEESGLLHSVHASWCALAIAQIDLNEELMPICCSECGSTDVEVKHWVSPNTGEVGDTCSDGEPEDNYCNDCESHSKLITVKEYEQRKV